MGFIHIIHRAGRWRAYNTTYGHWITRWYKRRDFVVKLVRIIYPNWYDSLYDISIHSTFVKKN